MSQGKLVFEKFIQDLRVIWSELEDVESRMKRSAQLLEGLVNDPALREHSKAWPSTEGPPAKNLFLYEDPDHGFVINAVVRTLDRRRGIHDHAHAWTAYGLVDGTEVLNRYKRLDDGSRDGHAEVELESTTRGTRGTVDLVPPFAIHSENGGKDRSVAVIVRSERLVGKVLQGRFKPDSNTTYTGEGPTQVPFELS